MNLDHCQEHLERYEVLVAPSSLGTWQRQAERLQERFDRFVDDLRRLSRKGALPEIGFGIIHHPDLNGLAAPCRDNRGVLVALYLGSVIQMVDTFYRLLSHRAVLPEVGQQTAVVDEPIPFLLVHEHVARGGETPRFYVPADPSRRAFADQCVADALDFLLMHELAHAWRGHLAPELNVRARGARRELGASARPDPERWKVDQALECDADIHAASFVQAYVRAAAREDPGALPARISAWTFAVFVFFAVMHLCEPEGLPPEARSHPHPLVRMRYAHAAASVIVQHWGGDDGAIQEGIDRALAAWLALGWPFPPINLDTESEIVAEILDATLKQLEPKLRRPFVDDESDIDTSGLEGDRPADGGDDSTGDE